MQSDFVMEKHKPLSINELKDAFYYLKSNKILGDDVLVTM